MDEVLLALAEVARIMGESVDGEIEALTREAERLTDAGQDDQAAAWRRAADCTRERRDAWVRLGAAAERAGR